MEYQCKLFNLKENYLKELAVFIKGLMEVIKLKKQIFR